MIKFNLINKSLILGMTISLAGCVVTDNDLNSSEAKGSNQGELVVFSSDSSQEVFSVLLNDRFLGALLPKTQTNQKLCSGTYDISAVAYQPNMNVHRIDYVSVSTPVTIQKDETTYLKVEQQNSTLTLTPVDRATWEQSGALKEVNRNLLRRLPSSLLDCQG